MNRTALMKITNIALFVTLAIQITTAILILLRHLIPSGRALAFILELHEYNGILFIVLAVLHVWQNRGWIKVNILKKK